MTGKKKEELQIRDLVKQAAEAHSNINAWGAVIALLEGGLFYGGEGNGEYSAIGRVIKIAQIRQKINLARYDDLRAQASLKAMGLL